MRIRPAKRDDAAAIAAIYGHYVETTAASFEETAPEPDVIVSRMGAIQSAGLPYLVAEDAGTIVGFGYLARYHQRSAYRFTAEDSVYVAPEARGRGVGRALLEALLEAGREAGLREVIAIIALTEERTSAELHRAFGFEEVGRLRAVGFKHGRRYDTLLMQRSLTSPRDPATGS